MRGISRILPPLRSSIRRPSHSSSAAGVATPLFSPPNRRTEPPLAHRASPVIRASCSSYSRFPCIAVSNCCASRFRNNRASPFSDALYSHPMPLVDPTDSRPVHFVGVAGAGMSDLAELLVRRGATVTGCDNSLAGAADLKRLGLSLQEGHDPRHVEGARAVVVTSAVPKNHPELERAREL